MNDKKLNTNEIGLEADKVKKMAKKIPDKMHRTSKIFS
jgi:hypothetical protein